MEEMDHAAAIARLIARDKVLKEVLARRDARTPLATDAPWPARLPGSPA